ncbi:MAG: RtcB family protein [Nanoarchaeota archaeon]|nr:RtcB family protein [Nanoarchaeota archaeon]
MKKVTNFALNLDDETKRQFDLCSSQSYVTSASLMPDAHSGYVAPIGSVLQTKNTLVPAWIGYDIGCGMIACKFSKKGIISHVKKHSREIFEKVTSIIPMGKGSIGVHGDVSEEIKEKFRDLVQRYKKVPHNASLFNFINTQAQAHLGSLGSGNHFIELGVRKDSPEDELWLIVHSGSRGVGHKVATEYMKKASRSNDDFEKTAEFDISTREGEEYYHVVDFGQEFALLNRLEMAIRVRDVLRKVLGFGDLSFELFCNKNHNFVEKYNGFFVHRKGATPAKKGELGVIPANMRDGCFLVKGLGNKDFLESSSHGAGRILSRGDAKKVVGLEEFEETMRGIVGTVSEKTLDESPFVYKNIYDVMEKQKASVEVIGHIVPLINWKGN